MKRYRLKSVDLYGYGEYENDLVEHKTGEWVKHFDVQQEIADLRARLAAAEEALQHEEDAYRCCAESLTNTFARAEAAEARLGLATVFRIGQYSIELEKERWLLYDLNAPCHNALFNHDKQWWTGIEYSWSDNCSFPTADAAFAALEQWQAGEKGESDESKG